MAGRGGCKLLCYPHRGGGGAGCYSLVSDLFPGVWGGYILLVAAGYSGGLRKPMLYRDKRIQRRCPVDTDRGNGRLWNQTCRDNRRGGLWKAAEQD